MVKLIGPAHSFGASGKLASMVFGNWRGIDWARELVIPANPQTAQQVNIRTALTLAVAEWQAQSSGEKLLWDQAAAGQPYSGYNLFMRTALDFYISQLGITIFPTSVVYTPAYPGTFVWTA